MAGTSNATPYAAVVWHVIEISTPCLRVSRLLVRLLVHARALSLGLLAGRCLYEYWAMQKWSAKRLRFLFFFCFVFWRSGLVAANSTACPARFISKIFLREFYIFRLLFIFTLLAMPCMCGRTRACVCVCAHVYFARLRLDSKNVAALHCVDGKSTTGLAAACWLLFDGVAATPAEAIGTRMRFISSLILPRRHLYIPIVLLKCHGGGIWHRHQHHIESDSSL